MTGSTSEAAASDKDAAARRRRRAVLRAHHPDLGGDPAELIRRLAELDHGVPGPGERTTFVRRPGGLGRVAAGLRRTLRQVLRRPRSPRRSPRRVL